MPDVVALGFQHIFRGEESEASFAAGYLLADTLRLIRDYLTAPRK